RGQERRVADRRPQHLPGGIGEARDGIPGRHRPAPGPQPEPAVPREVLELDGADEDAGVETAPGIPRDVLDTLGELRVPVLPSLGVAEDHALASRDEVRAELALDVDPLRVAVEGAAHPPAVERLRRLAARSVHDRARGEKIRVIPPRLVPWRARPPLAAGGGGRGAGPGGGPPRRGLPRPSARPCGGPVPPPP